MNPVVALLSTHMPGWAGKVALGVLLRATARAFGCPAPSLARLSADECLLQYAQFTQGRVAGLLRDGADLPAVQERLYRNAYQLGRACKWLSCVGNVQDAMALGRALYRLLDIEFQGDEEGVVVSRCYFSRFYSGQVCQVMSAMDQGLLAGLSDGRQLAFSARITGGQAQCRARWNARKDSRT